MVFSAPAGLDLGVALGGLGRGVEVLEPGRYLVRAAGSPELTARLANWLAEQHAELTDLRTTRSLEETYLSLVEAADSAGHDEPPPPVDGGADEGRGGTRPAPRRCSSPMSPRRVPRRGMTLRRGETLLLTVGIPVTFLVFFSTVHVVNVGRPR